MYMGFGGNVFFKYSTYYRFINIVRDNNIPFGFIHSTNVSANIKQIYDDVGCLL